MPRKVQHRVQTHWDHFRTRDHFSLREPDDLFLIRELHIPLVRGGANNPSEGLLAKKSKKKVWINQKQSRYNVPIFYVNGDKKP